MRHSLNSPVRRRTGAAAIALATTLALAGCSGGSEDPVSASDQSSTPAPSGSSEPSPTQDPPTEPAEPSDQPTSAQGTAVPVYFVTSSGSGPRLVREFRRVAGDPLTQAAGLVAGGEALDPDYRTLWPQVEISSVTPTDGVLLVEIPSDGFTERPDGMSSRVARLALQQLVYTLQGVQQERVPVMITRSGTEARLFGIPTDSPLTARSPLRTLNLVNITSPAEGDTVTGDTLTVTGVANSFEASGPCRLIVGDEEVALVPYQSEGWMEDRLFPFEVELPLADVGTGEVLVQCETDDPSGGAEGNGPAIDTKLITVR